MSNKKKSIVLLNIKNFGVNQDLESKNNLFKLVPFDNFKRNLNVFNTSQLIEYQMNVANFKAELFFSFGLQTNNFLKVPNFNEKFTTINEFLIANKLETINDAIHIFVHIENEFEVNNAKILLHFLEMLQTFLENQEYTEKNNLRFCLNLIVSRPLYNWDFFKKSLGILQSSVEIKVIINSLTPSKQLLKSDYENSTAEDFFTQLLIKDKKHLFNSITNVFLKIESENRIDKLWINENYIHNKIEHDSLVVFLSMKSQEVSKLSKLLEGAKFGIKNIDIEFDKYVLNNEASSSNFLNEESISNTLISSPQRDNFLMGLFPSSSIIEVRAQEDQNSYKYIYKLASNFYQKFKESIISNEKKVITLNWNIFAEAKMKYENIHVWIYSILIFDIFISKIISTLNRKRIKWMLFSTSYGFERMFKIHPEDKFTTLYLTNRSITSKEIKPISILEFQRKLVSFLLDENKMKIFPKILIINRLNLERKKRLLSKIDSEEKLLQYLKKASPLHFNKNKILIDNLIKEQESLKKMRIEKGISFLTSKKIPLIFEDLFMSLYYEEKKLYSIETNAKIADVFDFYKKANKFMEYLKSNPEDFRPSSHKNNSVRKIFYNKYISHLNRMSEKIENSIKFNNKNNSEFTSTRDIVFFAKSFKKLVAEYKELILLRNFHLEDSINNYKMLKKHEIEKKIKASKFISKWKELHNKVQDKTNQEYRKQFKLGVQNKQISYENIIAVDDLVNEQNQPKKEGEE